MILRNALAEAFDACMAQSSGRCRAKDIVSEAQHKHPELFLRESERLIVQAALREAKALMKSSAVEDVSSSNQQDLPLGILPGMRPPLTVIVPLPEEDPEDKFEYVRYDCATWEDLEAALEIKTTNMDRAIARKEDHLLKMDALRLYLQGFPGRTVGEACELMKKGSEA